jgi:hypothetical protein
LTASLAALATALANERSLPNQDILPKFNWTHQVFRIRGSPMTAGHP